MQGTRDKNQVQLEGKKEGRESQSLSLVCFLMERRGSRNSLELSPLNDSAAFGL